MAQKPPGPIPIRFSAELLRRLEATAEQTGVNRVDLIRIGVARIIEEFERTGAIQFRPGARVAEPETPYTP